MKASQYAAIRKAEVDEFAIYPADIAEALPPQIQSANAEREGMNIRSCPTRLVRARIVEDRAPWVEPFTLGCGDTEYTRERKNGVLVEVSIETYLALINRDQTKKITATTLAQRLGKGKQHQGRTRLAKTDDGERVMRMVVSVGAIMAPWNEYALIEAEREKAREEHLARLARLTTAVEALGGDPRESVYLRVYGSGQSPPPKHKYDYATTREWGGHKDRVYLRGRVVLTLAQAEALAERLAE